MSVAAMSSRTERLKEEIGWLKVYFAAFFAVDVSVAAWIAQNFDKAEIALVVAGLITMAIMTTLVVLISHRAHKLFDQLEKR